MHIDMYISVIYTCVSTNGQTILTKQLYEDRYCSVSLNTSLITSSSICTANGQSDSMQTIFTCPGSSNPWSESTFSTQVAVTKYV